MTDQISRVLSAARDAVDLPAAETELDRASSAFDAVSREWDDVDAEFRHELYKAGGRYKNMPPEIHKRRAAVGYARGHAAYRLELAEFALGHRQVKPRHPDDGGVSPFHTKPFDRNDDDEPRRRR